VIASLFLVTDLAALVAVLVGVGVAEALALAEAVALGDSTGVADAFGSAVAVGSEVDGAPTTKPDSAAWPIDQDAASTPRLITPTTF
jgi:hypothetical protein